MSASNERVFYAVGRGKEIGIYDSWKECKAQTDGYCNAKYRKFYNLEDAKEFVNFWKNYSTPLKETNETSDLMDLDGNSEISIKTENRQPDEIHTTSEQELTSTHQSPSHFTHCRSSQCASPNVSPKSSQKEINALAVNLRMDSLEKRFDTFLKEVGGITSEISHLRSEIKELKEAMKNFSQSGSSSSPRKGRDGLMQTTLKFNTNSPNKASIRSYVSSKGDADSGEPESKRGRTLKRKLSRTDSLTEDSIDILLNSLKPETVDFSTFTVDDEDFVVVFTDGSALSNGTKEAKAGIGIWFGDDHPLNVAEPVAGPATNITAEIQAARVAIQVAIRAGVERLKIHTDSEFVINCATKWIPRWKKNGWTLRNGGPVKNRKELEKLDEFASKIRVEWEKVLAHSKIKGNETADRLANKGATRYER